MNYRSIADLNKDVIDWIADLPHDLDLIVGIPRSGLLVANLLALHLGLPMTDFNGLLERRLLANGRRNLGRTVDLSKDEPLNVLIVDDSLHTGAELDRTRAKLAQYTLPHRIQFGAVYVQPGWEKVVDFHRVALAHPRAFEWNIFHHPALDQSCVDIDGILCRDPLEEENDDAEGYVKFLEMVRPKFRSSQKIGYLVTCRLEKYRPQTEAWLAKHNIEYGELIMLDLPNAAARRAANPYARHKADAYKRTAAWIFLESSEHEAIGIATLSGRPVYCADTRQMVFPGGKRHEPTFKDKLTWKMHRLQRKARTALRGALGRGAKASSAAAS